MPEPIPVHVLTGFLGSGKTTLLNRWLAEPALADTAVVVNEFGEVGIDHALVAAAEEDLLLLQSGCVCCSIRGDLVDALADLAGRRSAGEIPPFRRVVLETTGLADPGPILQTLMTDPALVGRYRPGSVTATADAMHGLAQLDEHPEAVRQAAFADRIVLTKLDIAGPGARAALTGRLAAVNATGRIVDAAEAAPDDLLREASAVPPDIPAESGPRHAHRHGEDIRAFCHVDPRPLRWSAFVAWLDALTSLRGADILRIKGIVNVEGRESPVVVNGVHHVLHPPATLAAWPGGRRETRLAVITRGIDGLDLGRALAAAHAHNPH